MCIAAASAARLRCAPSARESMEHHMVAAERPTPEQLAQTTVHVLWINAGLSCDGDSVSLTAATQPSVEDIAHGRAPRSAQGRLPLAARRLPGRRRLHAVVLARPIAANSSPLCSSSKGRSPTRRSSPKATGPASATTPTTRPADDHETTSWIDRLAPQAARGRRRRYLRDVRRHPRDGGQPHRRDGRARLSRLGLALEGRHPHRLRARLPDPARQPLGDARSTCSTRRPARRR